MNPQIDITRTSLIAATTLALGAGLAQAQPTLVLTRYAQEGDPVSDDAGAVLDDLSGGAALENGTAVIEGSAAGGSGLGELFASAQGGPLTTVYRDGDVAPNGFEYGGVLGPPIMVNGVITWQSVGSERALVQLPFGADPTAVNPTIIAVRNTTEIPGRPGEVFTRINGFAYDGTTTVFAGDDASFNTGLYRFESGALSVIMDITTPSPFAFGGGTISRCFTPFIRAGQLAFKAQDTTFAEGLLADFNDGTGLRVIVEDGDPLPGGVGAFRDFGEASIEGDYMAFQSRGGDVTFDTNLYLYQRSTDTITTITDDTVQVPGEAFTFSAFEGDPSISGLYVLFDVSSLPGSGNGLYLYSIAEQTITPVVLEDEPLDGRVVTHVDTASPSGGSENQFGFTVRFDGGDEAGYILTVIDACFADCNADATLNVDDVDCFVAGFLGGDLSAADCDGNLVLNVDDVDCFVAGFLGGCP